MQHMFSYKAFYMILFLITGLVSFSTFNGCDDAGIDTKDPVSHVVHFDSIGVDETINANSLSAMNLLNGTTVIRDSASADVQLIDSSSSDRNYYLRSMGAILDNFAATGYITRFNRIHASMTMEQFDTITVIPDTDTALGPDDFTEYDTKGGLSKGWGYFNAPMSLADSKTVYSFWLKQKSEEFVGRNIYGILIAREATDENGNFRMSFEVRINTQGLNDFKHVNH
jgi:hypothetical protein